MRTESRVTGAGPHPGGPARWARRGMRPHPGSMASRPAGRLSVQQLDSEARRPGGPRAPAPPVCGIAGGGSDARLGWDPRAQLRDADCGLIGTPYRQQPLGQFAGPCHRVRPVAPPSSTGSTSRPALGRPRHGHPRRERRTTGPRQGTAQGPPPTPKVEYRRPVSPAH
jgi:hypothetical protein